MPFTPVMDLGVVPLKMIIIGSMFPAAVHAKVAVAQHFSDFVVLTLIVFLAFSNYIFDGTMSI